MNQGITHFPASLYDVEKATKSIKALLPQIVQSPSKAQFLLAELLDSLQYTHDPKALSACFKTYQAGIDTRIWLMNSMAALGFTCQSVLLQNEALDPRLLPAILLEKKGPIRLLASEQAAQKHYNGEVLLFSPYHTPAITHDQQGFSWLFAMAKRFRKLTAQVSILSAMIALLALAVPLFIMNVYDKVLGSGELQTLSFFAVGIGMALIADYGLRRIRNRTMAWFGARVDHMIITRSVQQLLHLAPPYTERASVAGQVSRLRDFDSVREFFAGPLATAFLELPFAAIILLAIGLIAGPIVLIPITMLLAYALLLFFTKSRLKHAIKHTAHYGTKRQEMQVELLSKLPALRLYGAGDAMIERYRTASSLACFASFKTTQLAHIIEVCAHFIMMCSGMAAIGWGVVRVMGGQMSAGALIATMMLIWRALAPLHACCNAAMRLRQTATSIQQAQKLLQLPTEIDPYAPVLSLNQVRGEVTFERVSVRYTPQSNPVLMGVSFTVKPGEIVAIKGKNGAGKTTVLKLINGMYAAQGGAIRIDGVDIRQLNPRALRSAIAYVPQQAAFFSGSLLDNLRLAEPGLSEEQAIAVLKKASAWEEVSQLPHAMHTQMDDAKSLPFKLQSKLNLARAMAQASAKIVLLDEAANSMGKEGDTAFRAWLESIRGHKTVFLVTHREDQMQASDRLLVLDQETLVFNNAPALYFTHTQQKQG